MYWQKRLDRENPDKEIEEKILEIRETHKNYGYRRVVGELRNQGYCVNKKKVQRIMQKLVLQVTSFTRKSRKYSSYKGKVGTVAPNRIRRRFNTYIPHQKITTDTTEFKYYEINANDVTYYSYDELKLEIERYIKYYNEHRIKEKLGWISPVQYRLKLLAA